MVGVSSCDEVLRPRLYRGFKYLEFALEVPASLAGRRIRPVFKSGGRLFNSRLGVSLRLRCFLLLVQTGTVSTESTEFRCFSRGGASASQTVAARAEAQRRDRERDAGRSWLGKVTNAPYPQLQACSYSKSRNLQGEKHKLKQRVQRTDALPHPAHDSQAGLK